MDGKCLRKEEKTREALVMVLENRCRFTTSRVRGVLRERSTLIFLGLFT